MQLTKVLALVALFAGTAFAAPAADADANPPQKPPRPPKPTKIPTQSNYCGNGVTPYCCNSDGQGSYNSCSVISGGSICSTTIVCCNANDSVQVCIGDVNVVLK